MNRLLFFLVMRFAGIWRGMGADVPQLKALLDVKLKMDDRKPLSFGRSKEGKKHRFTSTISTVLYLFMGFIYIYPIALFDNVVFAMTAYYIIFMFLLTFSLITDFSTVLIDSTDKFIVIPRPVNDRTLFLSRTLYMFIYLFRVVLPMSIPGWVLLGYLHGWAAALVFPVPLLMMVFLCLFLVNAVYLLILRLAPAGKFKDVIGTFQIAFSIFIIAFYYLLQGVSRSATIKNIDMADFAWVQLTPPYWLGSMFTWGGYSSPYAYAVFVSVFAFLLPLASLWFTVKFLAPTFGRKIAAIDGVEVETVQPNAKPVKAGSRFYQKLTNLLNRHPASKAGFMITWLQTSRSRAFKMKVYPALAYVPVMFMYQLLMQDEPFAQVWRSLPDTKLYLLLLYMSSFVVVQALNYVTISDQYKAAWVYYSSPLETPGRVITGAFKALWIKFLFPFIAILGIFVVYVWGVSTIIDVVLAMVNVSAFSIAIMRISHRNFPFSMMEKMKETGMKSIVRVLLSFMLIGLAGAAHYLAGMYFWWMELVLLLISVMFFMMVWESCKETTWKDIRTAEA